MRWLLCVALLAAGCGDDASPPPDSLRVVTFNTGTTPGLAHDAPPDDGYGSAQAAISDRWYGDGLAWRPAIDDVRRFLDDVRPDLVAFQEIFANEDCATIPIESHRGWACDGWHPGAPSVAHEVLGPGFQVACHPGKPDKCIAVRRSFGSIRGCDADRCLDALAGEEIAGCGRGARVARAIVDRVGGTSLTVVSVHGTSGFGGADVACRTAQFEQIFTDLGDGSGMAAANGSSNVVLGDFNTDPGRAARLDASAAALQEATSGDSPFRFVTETGPNATPTYLGIFNIDHVIADELVGSCFAPGTEGGGDAVSSITYFDHAPVVCDLGPPSWAASASQRPVASPQTP